MGMALLGSQCRILLLAGLAALGIVLLAGCGASDSPEAPAAPATAVTEPEQPPDTPTPTEDPEPVDTPTPTKEPGGEATSTPEALGPRETGQVDGVTFAVGQGSEATFTVEEKFARVTLPNDAVMRTTALSGQVHLDGRPSVVEIDLHRLSSDQSRRDGYVRTRMFPNDPIATFTLDDATPLPAGFTEGEPVTAQVTGQLQIRGVQAPVTFDVEARDDGDVIFILGRTSFVWDDFQIPPPNIAGFVQVVDEVRVEVCWRSGRPLNCSVTATPGVYPRKRRRRAASSTYWTTLTAARSWEIPAHTAVVRPSCTLSISPANRASKLG